MTHTNCEQSDVPRETTVIETVLAIELDHQALLEITRSLPHDLRVTVLEDVVTSNLDLTVARLSTHGGLTSEVDKLPAEVALVLRHISIERRWQTRIVPCRRLRVVIDKVHTSS